jgi:hypothetical protein
MIDLKKIFESSELLFFYFLIELIEILFYYYFVNWLKWSLNISTSFSSSNIYPFLHFPNYYLVLLK